MGKLTSRRAFWLGLGLAVHGWGNPRIWGLGAIATLSLIAPAEAATLTAWRFDASTRQLEITVPEGTTPRYFLLAQPARIVIDLPNTDIGAVLEQQTYTGAVRQIRVNQFQPGLTRIVIELAPNTELQPQQVDMQRIGADDSPTSDRWILRPLVAGDTAIARNPAQPMNPPSPRPTPTANPDSPELPTLEPAPIEPPNPDPQAGATNLLSPHTPPATAIAPAPIAPPPLEPGATEIPIELPASETAIAPSATELATPVLPDTPASASNPNSTIAATPSPPEVLPPATVLGDRPVTVTVPPLTPSPTSIRQPPSPLSFPPSSPSLLPPTPSSPLSSPPPTSPTPSAITQLPPPSQSTASASEPTVVAFGQPLSPVGNLPTLESATPGDVIVDSSTAVLIPSGTVLSLRYPGEMLLELETGTPWQEVLVLTQAIRDRSGAVIAPEGSQVIGQFETNNQGSKFVVRAITIQGQNITLSAESEMLAGDRQVSRGNLVRNSAIGGLALALLTGFTGIGLIGGLAAGAATTVFAAPQPAIIQPNQIIEVRVMEDVSRSF